MKIVIDAYGGDNAPLCVLKGAALAKGETNAEIALTGSVEGMKKVAADNGVDLSGIELVEAESVIDMHDDPKCVLKAKKDSSMSVGLSLVAKGQADAFVSAGSTAALLMGATLIVGRLKNVKRPALGAVIPSADGHYMLLDCGANAECRPEMLEQFGVMGSVYMNKVLGINEPRVALANNGAEETKGTELQKEAYGLLSANDRIKFIGNIEGRDIPSGAADVVVADGFSGNLILKTIEGAASTLFSMLKSAFYKSFATKLAAAVLKPALKEIKNKMDYSEAGGAPFLGLKAPVVKAHGSSDERAIKNAIKQAEAWAAADVSADTERAFAQ